MTVTVFSGPAAEPTSRDGVWSLLTDPRRAETLDAEEARKAIAEVAAAQSTLAALQCVLLGRSAAAPPTHVSADENMSVAETARRTGMSRSYLYKNADSLTFTVRIGKRVLFSARGLERWQKQQQALQRVS